MQIVDYEHKHRNAAVALMAELQEFERALSADRVPGAAMATERFDYLLRFCEAESGKVLLALAGEEVTGLLVIYLGNEGDDDLYLSPEYERYGYISDLIVKEKDRGSEAAALLVKSAEQHCAALGVCRVKVVAFNSNHRARRFYENSGYKEYEITYSKDI